MVLTFEVLVNKKKEGGYHLGKMILDFFLERPPEGICHIDAATGEQETFSSVLARSIQLTRRLRRDGFRPGDVLLLGGNNHLDIHIPFYAAHFNGHPVVGVDPFYKFDEIKFLMDLTKPKIAFCQNEMYGDYARAAKELGIDVKIVTFDGGECSFKRYLQEYEEDEPLEKFKPADFDTEKIYAWLVSTSGTSGVPKLAAFHHHTIVDLALYYIKTTPPRQKSHMTLNISPVQWISSYLNSLGMITDQATLQTSRSTDDPEHIIDIINRYKPNSVVASPAIFASIVKSKKPCDLTCFETITLTGSKIYKQLNTDLRARMSPDAHLVELYGQTESLGAVLQPNPKGPFGSCGVPMPTVPVKLVDPETNEEITKPNVTGELLTKGPRFACYYNNPEETAKAITEDGWYRTGDLLYRDENDNYFYVDRLSALIKYRGNHVDPPEVEEVIIAHPDVLEVGVTGVPHPEDCERTVACVVLRPGSSLSERDIKKMVADRLSAGKHLYGGVVFMEELPKTSTGKLARAKLKNMIPSPKDHAKFIKIDQDEHVSRSCKIC